TSAGRLTVRFVEHEKLNTCVHCGLCLAACPTYLELGTETDSPRGRIHLMRALEEGTLRPTPEVVRHLDLCLGCRACETACPSGVPYGSLIEAARPFVERHRSWARRLGRRALVTLLTTRAGRAGACAGEEGGSRAGRDRRGLGGVERRGLRRSAPRLRPPAARGSACRERRPARARRARAAGRARAAAARPAARSPCRGPRSLPSRARAGGARGAARPAGRHPGRPSGRAGRGRHVLRERRHLLLY